MLSFKSMREAMQVEYSRLDDDIMMALSGKTSEPVSESDVWDCEFGTMCKACGCMSETPDMQRLLFEREKLRLQNVGKVSVVDVEKVASFDDDFAKAFGGGEVSNEPKPDVNQIAKQNSNDEFVLRKADECLHCGSKEVYTLNEVSKERD